jgi:hypothetical protein
MFGRIEVGQTILSMIILAVFVTVYSAILINDGKITIETSYKAELDQCENKLEECIESKTPSCAPCVCSKSGDY